MVVQIDFRKILGNAEAHTVDATAYMCTISSTEVQCPIGQAEGVSWSSKVYSERKYSRSPHTKVKCSGCIPNSIAQFAVLLRCVK